MEAVKSKIKVLTGLAPAEGSPLGLQMAAFSPCAPPLFPPCVLGTVRDSEGERENEGESTLVPLCIKSLTLSFQGPTLLTSFNIN